MPDSFEAIPDVVYHYTSMDTLCKIQQGGVIRATSVKYLNDVSERDFFLTELKSALNSTNALLKFPSADLLSLALSSEPQGQRFYDFPFVASFSRDDDSLPQWRAYCPNGNGVAIGVRTASLVNSWSERPRVEGERWYLGPSVQFAPVRYLTRGSHVELYSFIRSALENATRQASENTQSEAPVSMGLEDFLWSNLENQASLTKDSSFQTEREYRLVVSNIWAGGKVKFRSSRTTLVPYVDVTLPMPDDFLESEVNSRNLFWHHQAKPHFIHSVRIGPTPNPELSRAAVEKLFDDLLHPIEVTTSEVPYRDAP